MSVCLVGLEGSTEDAGCQLERTTCILEALGGIVYISESPAGPTQSVAKSFHGAKVSESRPSLSLGPVNLSWLHLGGSLWLTLPEFWEI